MGWKSSIIIINNTNEVNELLLLKELGLNNLIETKDEFFEQTIHPKEGEVYVGHFHNCLIICVANLPLYSLEASPSDVELILTEKFPDSEVCSLILHSVVNLWGYSVCKNGKKIRVSGGSADTGTMINLGNPLKEEKTFTDFSNEDGNGVRTYQFPNDDEIYTEDQVGGILVFELSKRYFGKRIDELDELLFETKLKGYRFS